MSTSPSPTRPIADGRLLQHDYDGIDEEDNPAPFWLMMVFFATIAFAAGYWIWFHAGGPGQTPQQELAVAWAEHEKERAAAQAKEQIVVSEEILEQMAASGVKVTRGAEVFAKNCVTCHADRGRGLVGPNLTDDYQIHGRSRMDIYQTVRDGVAAKGMLAWGQILPYDDLLAVVSYVCTLRGTNAPGGKPPEGEKLAAR